MAKALRRIIRKPLKGDGFWEFFPPEELPAGPNLQSAASQSVAEAVRRAEGRADNTTLLAFRYQRNIFKGGPVWSRFEELFRRRFRRETQDKRDK